MQLVIVAAYLGSDCIPLYFAGCEAVTGLTMLVASKSEAKQYDGYLTAKADIEKYDLSHVLIQNIAS
jgi:hypothetical protein